ncbi:hypothetical protein Mapa_000033 [Marchantia paleacea]|nr:hypothetical protein Mapa_000033 [Marchantia paleacea]
MAGTGITTDISKCTKLESKPGSPSVGEELTVISNCCSRKESSPESYGGGRIRRGAPGAEGGIQKNKKRFVGVRQRPSGRWVAEIKDTTQKIRLWLGTFDTAEDAARAYDEAAQILRGANTRTNFVPGPLADASALPSKAARLLLLRKNAAAAANKAAAATQASTAQSTSSNDHGSKLMAGSLSQRQQLMATSTADYDAQTTANSSSLHGHSSLPMNASSPQQQQHSLRPTPAGSPPSMNLTSNYNVNLSYDCRMEMNKPSDSRAFEPGGADQGIVEDMDSARLFSTCNMSAGENSAAQFDAIGNYNQEVLISNKNNNSSSCSDYPYTSCENGPIREIRKEQDYNCVAAPGRMDSLDTDISCSALSGLDDVDFSCVDSFDFSADMNISSSDLTSLMHEAPVPSCSSFQSDFVVDSTAAAADPLLSEHMRRRMYERNLSASLYAMNGVQECLMLYNNCSGAMSGSAMPYCMSSPSLSLPPSFKRSLSGSAGFRGSQNSGWTQCVKLGGAFSDHQPDVAGLAAAAGGSLSKSHASTDSSDSQTVTGECPSQDALWNSFDLSPLCVVA